MISMDARPRSFQPLRTHPCEEMPPGSRSGIQRTSAPPLSSHSWLPHQSVSAFDESHMYKSALTGIIGQVINEFHPPYIEESARPFKIFLTGTPIATHPGDLHLPFHGLAGRCITWMQMSFGISAKNMLNWRIKALNALTSQYASAVTHVSRPSPPRRGGNSFLGHPERRSKPVDKRKLLREHPPADTPL